MTSVISGKRVLGPPSQILEVQNAFAAYERIPTLNTLGEVKITDIFTDKDTDILSGAERKFLGEIVGFLDKNGSLSNAQAVSISGRGAVSVKKHLQQLTEKGFLKAVGANKGRRYFIAKT